MQKHRNAETPKSPEKEDIPVIEKKSKKPKKKEKKHKEKEREKKKKRKEAEKVRPWCNGQSQGPSSLPSVGRGVGCFHRSIKCRSCCLAPGLTGLSCALAKGHLPLVSG